MKNIIIVVICLISLLIMTSCSNKQRLISNSTTFNLEENLLKQGYSKIQLKKLMSGHLQLTAKINEVKGNFILDTGAGKTVIEKQQKEKFKLTSKELNETAVGAGGANLAIQNSKNNSFTLGDLLLTNMEFILMSLDHVNVAFEQMGMEKIDGVIGADILTNQKAIIDYVNLIIYLKEENN